MNENERPSISALLLQREHWVSQDGRVIPLPDMGIRHAQNLRRWLLKHANGIQFRADWAFMMSSGGDHGDAAQDAIDSIAAEFQRDSQEWMREQPLFEELTSLLTLSEDRLKRKELKLMSYLITRVLAVDYPDMDQNDVSQVSRLQTKIKRILSEKDAQKARR